ncbi:MAG: myo-inositol-1-phosphate synthase [Actinobacteria bacterium]|nr:MAG: myo-inositol-1-phosphate synthase [Actinomycetota bacterium]
MTVGVWFVGARGSLATTATVGAAALAGDLVAPTGLVTELAPFAGLGLPAIADLVIGGHDVAETSLVKRAEALAGAGVVPQVLLAAIEPALAEADSRLRRGIHPEDRANPLDAVRRVRADLARFRDEHQLERVVVINVSTTEPAVVADPAQASIDVLDAALRDGRDVLPLSSLYAYAAFQAGCSFVDFTPSTGARLPALEQLADQRGVPHAGRDGKTGETLVKSALAPMFATRNLHVRSWAGTNLLGGGDGAALAEPDRRESKLESKHHVLGSILGYEPDAPLHIDYVADLGEWKTAWDHISFEGFLGTRMRMQFTWEGCDSALAAPLVLDLARLVSGAHAGGHRGGLDALAFFFKDPWGVDEHRLETQFQRLCDWAAGLCGPR